MKILSLLNRGANKVIRSTKWYKEFWGGASKFWTFNTFNLDVVNLGSGAGVYAYNYSNTGKRGANWAIGPQSLVHDYNILRNYFSFIKKHGVVILTVCPFSGLISNYTKSHNLKYYTFLHPATIQNFDEEERTKALKIKINPVKEYPFFCMKIMISYYWSKIKHIMKYKRSVDLLTSAEEMISLWKRQFEIQDLTKPLSIKHTEELNSRRQTLEEIVEFCKERDLQPVIVIPPMHQSLSSKFPIEFQKNYIYPLLENIDAPVYNYMYDDTISGTRNFKTALFLSDKGAMLFTSKIINQLKKDQILSK